MNIDVWNIVVIIFFSGLGMVYLGHGKRQGDLRFILLGIALICYGYFTGSALLSFAIGLVLSLVPLLWLGKS